MLVLMCGNIGVGKTALSKHLEQKHAFVRIDADEIKKNVYRQDPRYEYNLKHGIPFGNKIRRVLCKKIILAITKFPTSYTIIIDEALPKQEHRKMLRVAAQKIGHSSITVWVTANKKVSRKRIALKRKGHMLTTDIALKMESRLSKYYTKIPDADIIIRNNGSIHRAKSDLDKKITKYLQRKN